MLADLIVAIHAAYVAFVGVGFLLILIGLARKWPWVRNPWFRLAHMAAILIVVVEAFFQITCPLTTWEYELRSLAGQPVGDASFIGRMLHYVLFNVVPEWALTGLYITFGLLVLATFVLGPPRWRKSASAQE